MNSIAIDTQTSNNLKIVDFHGQQLMTIEQDNDYYTAMKPICENIGLDWNGQFQRIKRDEVLSEGVCIINTPSKGGHQDTVCLPIKYLNGWLFGVDVKRVKPEIQDKLIMYKKECYQVLHDYWHNGKAVNPRLTTTEDRKPLKDAVNTYCTKSGAIYSDVWKIVHQRFGVSKVDQLTIEQIPHAVEYIHSMTLAFESSKQELPAFEYLTTAKKEAMEYIWQLQKTIKDLGGELPEFPDFDREELCRGFISRLMMGNRMMIQFGHDGQPNVSFVPTEHWVVSPNNLDAVIESVSKNLLPEIIESAVDRLAR